jgi:hypothetical protein
MIPLFKNQTDLIDTIADRLVENFAEPLFDLSIEKNYFVYLGTVAEIMSWSGELYDNYYQQLLDWENFKVSRGNTFHAITRDDFIIAWGKERMKKYMQGVRRKVYGVRHKV